MIRRLGMILGLATLSAALPAVSQAERALRAQDLPSHDYAHKARRISAGGKAYLVEMRETSEIVQVTVSSDEKTRVVPKARVFGSELAISRDGGQFTSSLKDRREAEAVADAYCAYLKLARAGSAKRDEPKFVNDLRQNNEWVFGGWCPWSFEGQP